LTNKDLATTIAAKSEALTKGDSIFTLIERMRPQIEKALPEAIGVDRFVRVALTEIRRNPKLTECSRESLLGALMLAAQLGLEPGSALGQCYLVPYGKECQFIIGYRGYIALAWRSNTITVTAREVHENDRFEFDLGNDSLTHTYKLGARRGLVVGVWAKAEMPNGARSILVMDKEEVDERRKRSRAANAGPWVTDYIPMMRKTAIRSLFSQLPLSAEAQRAAAVDEATAEVKVEGGVIDVSTAIDLDEVIDATTSEEGGYPTPMLESEQ